MVNTVKNGIADCISTLQECKVDHYDGDNAPGDTVSTLSIRGDLAISVSSLTSFEALASYVNYKNELVGEHVVVDASWRSSDSGVVSINSSTGSLTGVSEGNVTITAQLSDGSIASVPVIVS